MLPLTAAAAFLYIEVGFGTGGRSISASSSKTASHTWVTFWTAQELLAGVQKKKYRKGMKYFFKIKWWCRSVMILKRTLLSTARI